MDVAQLASRLCATDHTDLGASEIVRWLRTTQQFIDPNPVVKPLASSGIRRLWKRGIKTKLHRAKMGLSPNGRRPCD